MEVPNFIQTVFPNEPHNSGLIYAVEEFNESTYRVLTEFTYNHKDISPTLIHKSACNPIYVSYKGMESYYDILMERNRIILAINMECDVSEIKLIKVF